MTPSLPLEIIFQIIQHLIPPPPHPIALPATNILTKTLLSLSFASTAIHPIATKHLYTYCLFIDKPWRLTALLSSLSAFQTRGNSRLGTTDPVITSLVLEPYPDETIASREIADKIDALFTIIAPTLTRLVIDIWLRSIYPEDDTNAVRPVLRRAFQRLTALEVFCSTRDELYLDICGPLSPQNIAVWTGWPNLTTLALYNIHLEMTMAYFERMENIRTLVLGGADSVDDFPVHESWNEAHGCEDYKICPTRPSTVAVMREVMQEERHLELIFVNRLDYQRRPAEPLGTSKYLTTSFVSVPVPAGVDEDIEVCQEWVKELMVSAKPLEKVERMDVQDLWDY